ncbi:hypothetical protein TRAPUB_11651 [Trametes pubescens]|uniref:Uncharacterized protein n=1 Tax=Trametes pubescens TaxID=154538 RepID=A0A1M2VWA0_TRAPU|nr:hypothetical protein TRAPUB_11651 [Trametes pubescens]
MACDERADTKTEKWLRNGWCMPGMLKRTVSSYPNGNHLRISMSSVQIGVSMSNSYDCDRGR